MRTSSLLRFCTYTTLLSSVSAFSVSFTTPTQCDEFTVSWVGGQAPFYVLLTPKYHPLYNYTVPSSAITNGQGSYSIPQLPLQSGEEFLLTMSDSTGFGTGGTTTLLTVGAPIAGNNCNVNGTQQFTFQLPSALKQCALFNFTSYDLAVLPVTITALIPGGTFYQHQTNESSYSWPANVEQGTNLLFFMTDSQARQGGVSDLTTVAASTDNSCLVVGSPSSTMPPSQSTSSPTPSPSSKTSNVGIIAGSTVGGVAFLVLLIILGICCQRRASRSSNAASSLQRQLSGLRRKDDANEDGHIQSILPVNHILPPPQPRSQPHLANASASNPFSQHLPQMSYTDSFSGSSSIPSASGQMAAIGGQTPSANTFPYQTLPVRLAPPIHPGTYSHRANVSAGNFSVNDPHAQFSQIQPSRLSSNLDSSTGYGDPSRQMVMAGKPASQMYPFPYQTYPVSHPAPLTQPESLSHHIPTGSVSDPPSPINTTQPLRLSSNIERFANPGSSFISSSGGRIAAAATQTEAASPTQVLLHTDSEDVSAARDAQNRVELPPQYADRQLFASQPASALKQKSS